MWYAVMRDRNGDWGTGSYDFDEAMKMLRQQGEGLVAEIDGEGNAAICIREYELENNDAWIVAQRIKEAGEWDEDDCRELCELAGLAEEWDSADGETFESVIYKAAGILGVEVL